MSADWKQFALPGFAPAAGKFLNPQLPGFAVHTGPTMNVVYNKGVDKGSKSKTVSPPARTGGVTAVSRGMPDPKDFKDKGKKEDKTKVQTKKQQKEQPWNIRPGQEWKKNIIGKAQKTGKDSGHQVRSYKDAIPRAKQGEVQYLNRGMNRITGSKPGTHKPNFRPDVGSIRADGKIDLREVRSATDRVKILEKRMEDAHSKFPENMRGEKDVIEITRGNP